MKCGSAEDKTKSKPTNRARLRRRRHRARRFDLYTHRTRPWGGSHSGRCRWTLRRGDGGASLPLDLLNALKARPLSELDAVLIYVNAGGRSYSCRSSTVNPRTGSLAEPVLALYLKRELSVVDAVHQVGVEYRLTDREQEALIGVAMGLTSKELAVRMKISPNTVKAFLRLIMVKMGATTRAGIVGRLLDSERPASVGGSREY